MTYLIDLDGTMYEGTNIIDGAVDFINYLKKTNQDYYFFTNNSTRTGKQNQQKMIEMGFEKDDENKFITSSIILANYISNNYKNGSAFVIGSHGIKEALKEKNIKIVKNTKADYVICALDTKASYSDYSNALKNILNGAIFFATNMDRRYPKEDGYTIGNGAIVNMLEFASEKNAIKLGKPNPLVIDVFKDMTGLNNEDLIIIGDNLETDIALGSNTGIKTILVETGIHKKIDCDKFEIYPTKVIKNLKELIKII